MFANIASAGRQPRLGMPYENRRRQASGAAHRVQHGSQLREFLGPVPFLLTDCLMHARSRDGLRVRKP